MTTTEYFLESTSALVCVIKDGEKEIERKNFPLQQVSYEDLLSLRVSNNPGFVLKINNALFYAPITNDVCLIAHLGATKCATCVYCSPSKCPRISDLPVTSLLHRMDFPTAVNCSCRIEKYPFISVAIETFNVKKDVFGVLHCQHYKNHLNFPKRKLTPTERKNAKFALGEFFYDDLKDEEDLNNRLLKNNVDW